MLQEKYSPKGKKQTTSESSTIINGIDVEKYISQEVKDQKNWSEGRKYKEKINTYSWYVKEMFQPKISIEKKEELRKVFKLKENTFA